MLGIRPPETRSTNTAIAASPSISGRGARLSSDSEDDRGCAGVAPGDPVAVGCAATGGAGGVSLDGEAWTALAAAGVDGSAAPPSWASGADALHAINAAAATISLTRAPS